MLGMFLSMHTKNVPLNVQILQLLMYPGKSEKKKKIRNKLLSYTVPNRVSGYSEENGFGRLQEAGIGN